MFDGKTIIVTGASGGIGVPLVSRLIDLGARVIAIDVNPHGAEILAPAISDASRLVYHCSGIEDEVACRAILGQEEHLYGLVHLAGIFVPDDMASGDVETVYDPVMAANIRNLY